MLEEIVKRRSIRKFTDQEVEEAKIEDLLRAAMSAPTARNTQSWRFLVVKNREALNSMVELQPYTGMMKTASCAIIVMGDREASQPDEYLYVDAAAAIENMLLEAVHLNLGTCWCAIAPDESRMSAFRSAFDLPEAWLPVAVVAVGYAAEQKGMKDTFKPERITYCE